MTMTILDLYVACKKQIKEGNADRQVIVAYHWKGDTVVSDIESWCINGKSMQLNEEDFDAEMQRV